MRQLQLSLDPSRPLRVVALGAHPDDIEIGAGGTLLSLAKSQPGMTVHYVLLTGTTSRHAEARAAAAAFLPGAEVTVSLHDLPEGRLPASWARVKDIIEDVAKATSPDLVLAPSASDAHQDHRTVGEIVPTVFRDHLSLAYEVPKWDGDFSRPAMYFPLEAEIARQKIELLMQCFPSQHKRDWWDEGVFLGLARLRGMECRAGYAEAFACTKLVFAADQRSSGTR